MFYNCTNMVSVGNLLYNSNWQIANNVFENCYSLKNIGIIKRITGTPGDGSRCGVPGMFLNCYALEKTPTFVNVFTTGYDALTFNRTFYGCSGLIDASSINTVILENIDKAWSRRAFESIFEGCTKLTGGIEYLPHSDKLCVHNDYPIFKNMFKNCIALKQLPKLANNRIINFCKCYRSSILSECLMVVQV